MTESTREGSQREGSTIGSLARYIQEVCACPTLKEDIQSNECGSLMTWQDDDQIGRAHV